MTAFQSPDPRNYMIGKGAAYFTPEGGARRHLGNCTLFEIEPSVEELDHYSSMTGVRTKDFVAVIEKSGVIRLNLDEVTPANLRMALMGGPEEPDTEGNISFEVMAGNLTRGRLEFEGNNDIGPKWNYDFPSVAFRPNGPINAIDDGSAWNELQLEGEIEAVNGSFGRATLQDSGEAPSEAPSEAPTE